MTAHLGGVEIMVSQTIICRLCLTRGGPRGCGGQLGAVVTADVQQATTAASSGAAAQHIAGAALGAGLLLLADRGAAANNRLTRRQPAGQWYKGRPPVKQPATGRRRCGGQDRHRGEAAKGGPSGIFSAAIRRREAFVQRLSVEIFHPDCSADCHVTHE